MVDPWASFVSSRQGTPIEVRFTAREGVSVAELQALAQALGEVGWESLNHAYGAAADVPALLYAITLGADAIRREAWWELWGKIHHQGTVYEATVPALAFIAFIASSEIHPDRVEALSFLREIAVGNGAWAAEVRQGVRHEAEELLSVWDRQPETVQRALLFLVSAFPDLVNEHRELVVRLPDDYRDAWDELMAAGGFPSRLDVNDDFVMDRQDELERWALAGWPESG